MYIHDISRDTLTTETYPGDPETVVTPLRSIDEDDECNLSQISMCVHAGTHIDAPLHFCPDGKGDNRFKAQHFLRKMHRNNGQGCADGRRYGQAVAVLPKTHTLSWERQNIPFTFCRNCACTKQGGACRYGCRVNRTSV